MNEPTEFEYKFETPILFLIFNRLSTTVQAFETIRAAKPPRLYIAADGARPFKANEGQTVREVREFVLDNIDWDCEVKTLFRSENLGCKTAVSEAITWFFDHEPEGIILEDDVLPLPTFFRYCQELLELYRNESTVGVITGNNLISKKFSSNSSYFFSHYPNIWGWASWRRVWKHYDVELKEWPSWQKRKDFEDLSDNFSFFKAYWKDQIDAIHSGKMDTWDFQFFFTCWKIKALCAVPVNNLTYNLGFGDIATHTTGRTPPCVLESVPNDLTFPLTHPKLIKREVDADILINQRVFNISLFTVLKWKTRRVPLVGESLAKFKSFIKK